MRQSQKIVEANGIPFRRKYLQQMFVIVGVLLFSLGSGSAFALVPNNGSDTVCPAGSTSGTLNNASYNSLLTSYTNSSYQTMVSTPSNTIPLQIKMSKQELPNSNSNTTNSFTVNSNNSNYALNLGQKFANNTSAATNITLEFRNSSTSQPLYLSKVALSAFDIDASINSGNNFDDYVNFTGTTESGTIIGNIQTIAGSNVVAFDGGLRTSNVSNTGCTAKNLGGTCQGSVVFDEPVKSVTLTYKNSPRIKSTATTNQEIDFRIDSYCYLPPSYEVSKDDGLSSVATNTSTNYTIKVTNTGGSALQNIVLKDPAVTGLIKQSGITCDTTDTTNTCSTPPTIAQLESATGFTIPSLAVGKSYSIKVPTLVTAASGSNVTNEANIKALNLDLKSAADTNTVTSIFGGGSTSAPATCPANHQMYYLGASPPTGAITPTNLSWPTGSLSNEYTFGGVKFKLSFSDTKTSSGIETLQSGYPEFSSYSGTTINALNVLNSSQRTDVNHRLTAIINKPVSKYGFVVQDLDTNESSRYIESMNLVTIGGIFSNISNTRHTISNGGQTISGNTWENCNTNSNASKCDFNIDWGYKPALTPFTVTHGNTYSAASTTTSTGDHLVGYSDFYFCLAPPKVVVKKVLVGNRVNNTDQFNIKVSGGILTPDTPDSQAAFTTTGTGNTVSNATTSVLTLAPTTSYTITERVLPETNGNINNYSASYECTNATTDSSTPMHKGNGNSFSLSNLNYGDEITCIITNTANAYTFTGFVFNDNGGITAKESTRQDFSSTFTNNANYFNGIFDTSGNNTELGIGANGLQVRLTNCGLNGGTDIAGTVAQSIPTPAPQGLLLGQYKFTVPASALASLSSRKVCVVQVEPIDWEYSVDTTTNSREVILVDNIYNYSNIDFGEVKSDNASLVLIKSQYVNNCDINANYDGTTGTSSQTPVFSVEEITGMVPGKCIAYRIDAYNRGHVDLKDVQISDKLQTKAQGGLVDSIFAMPLPKGVSPAYYNGPSLPLSTITSNIFNLNKSTGATATKATLYFNTKYGTTNSAP